MILHSVYQKIPKEEREAIITAMREWLSANIPGAGNLFDPEKSGEDMDSVALTWLVAEQLRVRERFEEARKVYEKGLEEETKTDLHGLWRSGSP
jgi:hypothetical protein